MTSRFIRVLVALALVGVSLCAGAQADSPSKPIRLFSRNLLAGDALDRSLLKDRANTGAVVEKLGLKKK